MNKSIILAAFAALALTSCHSDNEADSILHPIADHLTGYWEQSVCLEKNEKGEWVDTSTPGYAYTLTFKANGDFLTTRTVPDGWQQVRCCTWKGDDENNGFNQFFDGQSKFVQLTNLTPDKFEIYTESAQPDGGGEYVAGEYKSIYTRRAEPPFVEKMIGKWVYSKTYEKVDGEWKDCDFAVPDEAWYDFRADGIGITYSKFGNQDFQMETKWFFNPVESLMRLTSVKTGVNRETKYQMADNNTIEFLYTENTDITGEIRTGEFKDVMIREK